MDNSLRVVIGEVEDFPPDVYRREVDKFQHALILPRESFRRMGIAPFSYVNVFRNSETESEALTVYAIPFAKGFTPDADQPTALLKCSLQREMFADNDIRHRKVTITPHDTAKSSTGESGYYEAVRLPAFVRTELSTCYMNSDDIADSTWSENDNIEVFNPETGGRIRLKVKSLPRIEPGRLAVSNVVRQMLDRKSVDELSDDLSDAAVGVHEPVHAVLPSSSERSLPRRLLTRVLRIFVGYNRINVRVRPGYDHDEERGIARVGEETQQLLGVDAGDRITIKWNGQAHSLRCLTLREHPPDVMADDKETDGKNGEYASDVDLDDMNNIYLPTTERREVYACIDDIIDVRRDMTHTITKRISLSVFGIIGVIIGGQPVLEFVYNFFGEINFPVPSWIVQGSGLVAMLLVISITIIWLLLWPERQKVSN